MLSCLSLSEHYNSSWPQLLTTMVLHLSVPWCPPFISRDDCVKPSVIRLGSDWVTGASASTHHSIPMLATSAACGEPCACCERDRLTCWCVSVYTSFYGCADKFLFYTIVVSGEYIWTEAAVECHYKKVITLKNHQLCLWKLTKWSLYCITQLDQREKEKRREPCPQLQCHLSLYHYWIWI